MSASTVILNGLTTHDYGTYYPYFAIRNDSEGIVYASTTDPECTPDTEGVVTIANGDGYMAANTDNDNTCLYLSGTGKVTVIAQHDKIFPFKKAQGGGDDETQAKITVTNLLSGDNYTETSNGYQTASGTQPPFRLKITEVKYWSRAWVQILFQWVNPATGEVRAEGSRGPRQLLLVAQLSSILKVGRQLYHRNLSQMKLLITLKKEVPPCQQISS